jgi:phage FluMu protein Com
MPQIDMVTIPEPPEGTRSVLVWSPAHVGPCIEGKGEGKGSSTFRCGGCKRVLAKDIGLEQIQNIVLKCPKCSSYNEMPAFTQRH